MEFIFSLKFTLMLLTGLEKMSAVQDQRRQLEKWRAKFTPTVTRQLNNLFIHLVPI